MYEKLAVIGNKRFVKRKRHFRPRSRWMLRTTLVCVRPVSLDIWCVAVFVPGLRAIVSLPVHPLSSFSSVRPCIGLLLSCFYSVLPVSRTVFSKVSSLSPFQFFSSKFRQYPREPYSNWYKFLVNVLSSSLTANVALPVICRCVCCLFKNAGNVSRNLI